VELGKASKQIFSLPPQLLASHTAAPPTYAAPTATSLNQAHTAASMTRRPSMAPNSGASTPRSSQLGALGSLADNYPVTESMSMSLQDLTVQCGKGATKSVMTGAVDSGAEAQEGEGSSKAGMAVMTMAGSMARRGLGDLSGKRSSILTSRSLSFTSNGPAPSLPTPSNISSGFSTPSSLLLGSHGQGVVNAATLSRGASFQDLNSFAMPTRRPKTTGPSLQGASSGALWGSVGSGSGASPRESLGGRERSVGWR
jgi:hypothetical protein